MTEKEFWSQHLREVLHQPRAGRTAWKVQDAYNKGLPDVDFVCGRNKVAKIELKYIDAWPARASTTCTRLMPSPEQHRHLEEWEQGGGVSLMILGVGDEWYLIHHSWLYPEAPTRAIVQQGATLCGYFRRNGRWKQPKQILPIVTYLQNYEKLECPPTSGSTQ